MIRRPPRSTRVRSSAASDVYKRQVQRLGREEGDDFLGELVGAVIIATVGDGGGKPEGLCVGADRMVSTCLGCVIRGSRPIGRGLGEQLGGVEREVSVDLAGGDVMEPGDSVATGRLGQCPVSYTHLRA